MLVIINHDSAIILGELVLLALAQGKRRRAHTAGIARMDWRCVVVVTFLLSEPHGHDNPFLVTKVLPTT